MCFRLFFVFLCVRYTGETGPSTHSHAVDYHISDARQCPSGYVLRIMTDFPVILVPVCCVFMLVVFSNHAVLDVRRQTQSPGLISSSSGGPHVFACVCACVCVCVCCLY